MAKKSTVNRNKKRIALNLKFAKKKKRIKRNNYEQKNKFRRKI